MLGRNLAFARSMRPPFGKLVRPGIDGQWRRCESVGVLFTLPHHSLRGGWSTMLCKRSYEEMAVGREASWTSRRPPGKVAGSSAGFRWPIPWQRIVGCTLRCPVTW